MRIRLVLLLFLLSPPMAPAPVHAAQEQAERAADAGPAQVPLAEIQRYVSVYRAIRDAYVEPLDDEQLMKAALRGLLSDLDPHSAYLEADEAEALREETEGAYSGIGVEIEQRPDRSILVVAPIDGTPAQRAGLRAGDVIVAIDGQALDGGADQTSLRLRGEPGSAVTLTVSRPGEPVPREFTIVRERIEITSVSGRLLEPGFGYLRISAFQEDTAPQLHRQLARLRRESGGPLAGLVLDLRSNPGGLLNAAVEAADTFLEDGLIVSTRGRLSYANANYHAKAGDLLAGAPIVLLVDAGTASAAEVMAAALRDHRRALLMGSRTFGKGSVQTVVPLENGDSVKLTTARYYSPRGDSIQASGLSPDVLLRGTPGNGLREQDLPRHLRGDGERTDGYARGEVIEGEEAIGLALARLKDEQAVARRGD
ncbi:S41 family peptidase [Arenimonas fontis]|uniref:S41 family peptidase n=1 Tax=Arenimonas fontis TaxID=2608255 RepID=A0A5B2Z8R5_9GAMM|nr:S41 family peptidase [Arenimonas fontis]KAA2284586.1 S41 family peptidase [Arenimonas fontis]